MTPRKILYVTAELAPFAKVGGLADVAAALPQTLLDLGHYVRTIAPAYGLGLSDPALGAKRVREVRTRENAFTLYQGTNLGVPTYLLGGFGGVESIHRSEDVYRPDRDAYLSFAKGILAACEAEGWIPDVIHANDWHTGFLPVLLRETGGDVWSKTASIATIHNLAYQGEFGRDTVAAAGLSDDLFTADKLEFFGGVNFLKSSCVYADRVNTVSPRYAEEIQTPEYGCGLWGVMQDLASKGRLRGILNGIDTEEFNPERDRNLAANYGPENLEGKAKCRTAVRAELGLNDDNEIPLVAIISRLSDQKGFDTLFPALTGLLALPAQLVVLAIGDPGAAATLRGFEREWPDRLRFVEAFDAELAQRIYGGCDLFLMPSNFEPCGLGQLIALRYGALPIVRRTGGLADTVFEGENGFVFEDRSPRQLLEATGRAVQAFRDKTRFEGLVKAAMSADYGWQRSARAYSEMYDQAIADRRAAALIGV